MFAVKHCPRRGYTLAEVIVALAILLIGVVGVLQFFPVSLKATTEAALKSEAALLAQRKVEELRRDDDRLGTTVRTIQLSGAPTTPVPFPEDTRLAYQFSSRSLIYDNVDTVGTPEDDFGVARIVVRYNTEFRPSAEVLYELRFDR
ncbi:prepilin-type N-terminal cleavage/methylation domain-containing protein [Candidatus Sumerlaeota bacterium]|nr:prepilin-type N-terminal cleavage/methylation domain-containing protein [Candidatus Sumerlaeota bacterium]